MASLRHMRRLTACARRSASNAGSNPFRIDGVCDSSSGEYSHCDERDESAAGILAGGTKRGCGRHGEGGRG